MPRCAAISSVTMAGSVSIGAGAPPSSGPGGPSSGSGRMKPSRSRMVCSASPVSGSDFAHELQEAGAARRRGQPSGDVDEQATAGLGHGRGGRHLPEREPQGLHRVGHHLLVPDREVDVVVVVIALRERGTAW